MFLVVSGEQIQPAPLPLRSHLFRRFQIYNRIARRAKWRALIRSRHEAVSPIGCAANRSAAGIGEHYEPRKVLIFGSQAIGDPTTHARVATLNEAGVHLEECGRMIVADRMHGP